MTKRGGLSVVAAMAQVTMELTTRRHMNHSCIEVTLCHKSMWSIIGAHHHQKQVCKAQFTGLDLMSLSDL